MAGRRQQHREQLMSSSLLGLLTESRLSNRGTTVVGRPDPQVKQTNLWRLLQNAIPCYHVLPIDSRTPQWGHIKVVLIRRWSFY